MKKIAIFNYDLQIGGIEKSLVNLLNNIDLNTYQIDLYLFNKDIDDSYLKYLPDNINLIILKKKFKKLYNFLPFNIVKNIKFDVKSKKYDLAIDFNSYQSVVASACLQVKAKKRIMMIHNNNLLKKRYEFKYRILHFFMKNKYQYFDTFIGVSKGVIDPFIKLNKLPNKEYLVIPNIIDTNEIKTKMSYEINLNINSKKYNLVTVGRLCYQKGFDLLLKDFKSIITLSPLYHLYIVGDGEERKKISKLIKKYQLSDHVTLLGSTLNPYNIMNLMDGFVLTSRYEGQGMVILEAKALGLDIFIPKRLTNYVEDVEGTNDLINGILNAKKHDHQFNDLKKYNNKIKKAWEELFDAED